jgi:hypothetical protein
VSTPLSAAAADRQLKAQDSQLDTPHAQCTNKAKPANVAMLPRLICSLCCLLRAGDLAVLSSALLSCVGVLQAVLRHKEYRCKNCALDCLVSQSTHQFFKPGWPAVAGLA